MGDEAQWLLRALGLLDQRGEHSDQIVGSLANRVAPVVGKDFDIVTTRQEFDERAIKIIDQTNR